MQYRALSVHLKVMSQIGVILNLNGNVFTLPSTDDERSLNEHRSECQISPAL